MTRHVISTLPADTKYVAWHKNAGINMLGHGVLVKGGAGVALMGGGQIVTTPHGIRTEVSDADAAFLESDPHFQEHAKRGFVRILKSAQDPDKSAESMATDDGSRPKTPADVAASAKKTDDGTPPLQAVTNKAK